MPCGFGHADVVVAVPACWIDVRHMSDLEEMAHELSPRARPPRPRRDQVHEPDARASSLNKGVSGYSIVESLGATEGAPAALLAELIVDITTTGNTLRANELRTLSDGIILRSQAQLVSSKVASWSARLREIEQELVATLSRTHAPAEAKPRACHHSAKLRMRGCTSSIDPPHQDSKPGTEPHLVDRNLIATLERQYRAIIARAVQRANDIGDTTNSLLYIGRRAQPNPNKSPGRARFA